MQILTAHYAPLRCSVLVHPNANMVLVDVKPTKAIAFISYIEAKLLSKSKLVKCFHVRQKDWLAFVQLILIAVVCPNKAVSLPCYAKQPGNAVTCYADGITLLHFVVLKPCHSHIAYNVGLGWQQCENT